MAGLASNGTTYINNSGSNSHSSQHYFAASNNTLVSGGGYTIFTGYFKGHGTGFSGRSPNQDSPGKMYPGVAYIRPLFILNYSSGNGTADIEFLKLEIAD